MTRYIAALLLISGAVAWAQDEDEREYVASCSLSIKTMALPLAPDSRSGSVAIMAFLCENSGNPIPNQEITMTATNGTFSCMAPDQNTSDSEVSDHSCFLTNPDGTVTVYLINIPFNNPGRIKASCTYREFSVAATGSYSISRGVVKKKRARKAATAPSPVP